MKRAAPTYSPSTGARPPGPTSPWWSRRFSLARFEEEAGSTNTSTVRMETHACFGVERQAAAVNVGLYLDRAHLPSG